MGIFQHHAMLIMPYSEATVDDIYAGVKTILQSMSDSDYKLDSLLTPVIRASNGWDSFFVAPDGSKEGWELSNRMNEAREKIKELCYSRAYIIMAQFGELGNFTDYS